MKIIKTITIISMASLLLFGSANAAEGLKLGFGFDRGFGVVGAVGKLNGFIGNDGVAVDYIFKKDGLNVDANVPVYWFIGAGGYGDWDGDLGVRMPVGVQVDFAKRVDGYAQVMPRFRFNHNTDFGLDFAIGVRYQF